MKTILTFLCAVLGVNSLFCQPSLPNDVLFDGHVNCPAVSTGGGRVYLRLCIAGRQGHRHDRRPVNLCVVLDRSGSMSEEDKMTFAKSALYALVDDLRSDDLFSLVIYDDEVDVLRPSMRVGHDRERIRSLIDEIRPRGWTNLGGGMQEGFRQAERTAGEEYVNRVILLSDGLANQGITDQEQLERIARRFRSRSISLTTIGVGLDYNENLMMGLSESGGGNYYFLESCRNLASVFHKEFDAMSEVVGQNVSIHLDLGRGVELLDAIGYDVHTRGSGAEVALGDVYAGESREIMLELNVAPGDGELSLAHARLVSSGGSTERELASLETRIHYEQDQHVVERTRDLGEQAKVDVAISTRGVAKAMEALDRGDKAEASRTLSVARAALMSSPAANQPGAAGAAIKDQAMKISGYSSTLEQDTAEAKKAKKEIQYENYRQQKSR